MKFTNLVLALFVLSVSSAWGHEHSTATTTPKGFDTMKGLVGTWEGTGKMNGKDEPTTVVYEITSGGSVITEKMSPGTPHEMINVFHKEGTNLAMTHYCAMGNQPHMTLKNSTPTSLTFEMTKATGVSSMKETHMHALTLTMADANTLKEEWVNFEGGKKRDTVVITLKRKM